MKRLKNSTSNHFTLTTTANDKTRGFTLIELLFVLGIIAILIGLLLPAIQERREAFAHNEANATVNQLLIASNEYRRQVGTYPDSLDDLIGWNATNPGSASLDSQLATGRKNGYLYAIVENDANHVVIEAEPEFPGITGSNTYTGTVQFLLGDGSVRFSETPGADQARERMFNNLRAKAAETVVNLLNLDSSAITQVRDYTESPANVAAIVDYIDSDDDGRVSLAEIQSMNTNFGNPSVTDLVMDFLTYVAQEMKWNSLSDEARMLIRVDTSNPSDSLTSDQPPLFSYDGLSVLTETMISDGTSNTILVALLEKLEEAETAEANGNEQGKMKAIKNYQKQVKALIGQNITRNSSKILITLSKTL
ncbi:MAG: prepilin-type N-terminal cleavage/methylation domain-containing protein [Acidobacteriota bacterium]